MHLLAQAEAMDLAIPCTWTWLGTAATAGEMGIPQGVPPGAGEEGALAGLLLVALLLAGTCTLYCRT